MRNTLKKISTSIPSPRGRVRVGALFLLIPFTFYAQTNTFPASGNVGIGTSTPGSKLEIRDGSLEIISTPYAHFKIQRDNGATVTMGITSGTKHAYLGSAAEIKFLTNMDTGDTGTKMFLTRTGSLGIGTTNPGTWKLAVNGNIRAKEIKVETGWSDFVFEDSYNLPTLEEVEQHIKEKGHLKDIPSAKEVEENGIFLGEMDAKLLQKIEELMLYTLQQQKEIEILRQKIGELQEKQ